MTSPTASVQFDGAGLIPVIVQDDHTGAVLMLAYMNREALQRTRETGRAHYWSRSRGKLWRKGETSGNEQIVTGLRVNCEQNSLLMEVIQTGAVCHDGYPSCYYRAIAEDGSLHVVMDRAFDPVEVYGRQDGISTLASQARQLFAAYSYLRDHDLTEVSNTSRRLRDPDTPLRRRIADEMEELAAVLAGEHRHVDLLHDVRLEASQVIYWIVVESLRESITWDSLRPDSALATTAEGMATDTIVALLRSDARAWRNAADTRPAAAHTSLALVAQACQAGGIAPLEVLRADLAELETRAYMASFFAS